jgi:hypothetical protein
MMTRSLCHRAAEREPLADSDNAPRKHRGRGRPTKYAATLCDVVAELVRDGASTWRIAREIRVSRPTLYAWAKLHPEFLYALERGSVGERGTLGDDMASPDNTVHKLEDLKLEHIAQHDHDRNEAITATGTLGELQPACHAGDDHEHDDAMGWPEG